VALAEGSVPAAASAAVTTAAGYMLSPAALTFLSTSGPACFLFLQLSGVRTVQQILKDKTTGQLSLLPFASLFTNCVIWSWYGYLLGDNTVMLPNVSGMVCGAIYTAVFLRYAATSQIPLLAGSAVIASGVTYAALTVPAQTVLPYIGYLGDVLAVIMMASPLATIGTVLKDKSTRSMPFATSVATFFNAACWTGYGVLVMGDPLIYVPNMLGFAAASLQMALFARFGVGK